MLPIFKDPSATLMIMQNKWAAELNPLIAAPQNNSGVIENVLLANGTTIINHMLGRRLQGWKIVRQNAKASIYDSQSTNQNPTQTLILISDAAVTVSIEVF